jgi:prolyl-tRNA synthetase
MVLGLDDIETHVGTLPEIQRDMLSAANARRDQVTETVQNVEDAIRFGSSGFARIPWEAIKGDGVRKLAETSITVRCLVRPDGSLPSSEDESDLVAYVARAY